MAFNENTRVKIPAILHLCRLGYQYVLLSKAKWDVETNIFTEIFEESIGRINPELEKADVKRLLEDISLVLDNEDLVNLKTQPMFVQLLPTFEMAKYRYYGTVTH